MNILYEIMKPWLGTDVRVYFNENEGAFTGALAEICEQGLFLIIEGAEYFIPWYGVSYVKRVKKGINGPSI